MGCARCNGTGFAGRLPIAEAFLCDDGLLRLVAEGRGRAEIAEEARRLGLVSMLGDGINKAGVGLTTLAEVAAAADG